MKPLFIKRTLAFIIDITIVLFVSTLIVSFMPANEKVDKLSEKLNEVINKTTEKKVNIKQYMNEIDKINYEMTKVSVITTLIEIVIYILYFIVLPVYNNGQTVGKKLQHIKVKNKSNAELSINNMLFREIIRHGIWIDIIVIILVMFIKQSTFIPINNVLSIIESIILIVSIIMIIIRSDGRALHDYIGNTIVVNEEEK